jgi:hypothetical protein
VGEFSRRLTVSSAQAMICILKLSEILIALCGIVVAFLEDIARISLIQLGKQKHRQ